MKRIISVMASAALLAGCAKVSDTTVITGTFTDDVPQGVLLIVQDMEIEQMVDVVDSSFTVEVPTDPTVMGTIAAGLTNVNFVPDGTRLTIDFSGTTPSVTSDNPKISVQERYNTFFQDVEALVSKEDIMSRAQLEQDILNLCENAIKDNPDNVVGLVAISSIYNMLPFNRLERIMGYFADNVQDKEVIMEINGALASRKSTTEGQMFTDFTVVQDPSDPENTTVSFSDYIGKGKYVLVDFWASWCGPCIREIPNIRGAYHKYGGDDFDVLSIAVWDDPAETVKAAAGLDIEWNQIINAQQIPTDIYGIDGIPHIILFGPDGKIVKRDLRGPMIDSEIAKYVTPVNP